MNKQSRSNLANACQDLCDRIEDKILERGLFTKFLGKEFELSINSTLDEEGFSLQLLISTPKKKLKHESIVEMSFYVHEKFFEIAEEALNKSQLSILKKKWFETTLARDDKVIFVIDD